ncbi:MAG: YggS family pyridoxal phosphate-dependent enzyme [Phycicoccus sp.]|nr:YggS family pyridoxal phosphate-dependent enzyme [Phycicoccus sp.]
MSEPADINSLAETLTEPRAEELRRRLDLVRARIDTARIASGRTDEVHLVVVTKFFPTADVLTLARLGVTEIAENKIQEAAAKFDEIPRTRLARHFVGQVQTNKARAVAQWADVVQSVDRPRLIHALDRAAQGAGRRLQVLIQVGLDDAHHERPDPVLPGGARGGAAPAEVPALAEAVAACDGLQLRGVMAVAPLGGDPRAAFARLALVAERVRRDHAGATWISAGMSGDLEQAVAAGATHLRVGTAILGSRPSHR